MGDSEFAAELTKLFLADVGEQMKALSLAIQKRDFARIAGIAHRTKGASGNLGAENLKQLCGSLEEAARRGAVDDMSGLLEASESEFTSVRKHLVAVADAVS